MSISGEFWGKARPGSDGVASFHPLPAHSLDVAAVAVLLLGGRIPSMDPRTLGFLFSVHDIGKFSRPFQAKVPAYWPVGVLGPYPAQHLAGPAHDAVGASILTHALADRFNELLPGSAGRQTDWKPANRMHLWRALTGHHGRPPEIVDRLPAQVFCAACQNAAGQFIDAMKTVFQPPAWLRPKSEGDVIRLSSHLAGLTTLADWVGSRQA